MKSKLFYQYLFCPFCLFRIKLLKKKQKQEQRKHLIEMMRNDEELGLYDL